MVDWIEPVVMIGSFIVCVWLMGKAIVSSRPVRNCILVALLIWGVQIGYFIHKGDIVVNWSVLFG